MTSPNKHASSSAFNISFDFCTPTSSSCTHDDVANTSATQHNNASRESQRDANCHAQHGDTLMIRDDAPFGRQNRHHASQENHSALHSWRNNSEEEENHEATESFGRDGATNAASQQHAAFQLHEASPSTTTAIMTNDPKEKQIIAHFTSSMAKRSTTTAMRPGLGTNNSPPQRRSAKRRRLDSDNVPVQGDFTHVDSLEEQLTHSTTQSQSLVIQQQANEATISKLSRQVESLQRMLTGEREKCIERTKESVAREQSRSERIQQESQRQLEQLKTDVQNWEKRAHQEQQTKALLEDKVSQLLKENQDLNQKLVQILDESRTQQTTNAAAHVSHDKDYLIESLNQKLRTAQLEVERLQRERQSLEEHTELKTQLTSELNELVGLRKKLKSLQGQNTQLKNESENILLLKEENRKLNQQIDDNHTRDAEIFQFLNEYDSMKLKVGQWEDTFGTNVATEACHFMKALQQENQDLLGEREKLSIHCESLKGLSSSLKEEVEKLTKQLFSQESQLSQSKATIERQKNQIFLLEQERDSTTEVLKSYDRDQDDASQKRIQELESQTEKLQKRNSDLENIKETLEKSKQEALVEQRKMYMEEVTRLKQTFQEEQRQKILHLRLNPQVEASSKSSNELVRLRSQIKVLEERLRQITVSEHTSHLLAQKQEEFAKRIQRHNEVFREKISEFRRAMYLLCGYRVDVLDDHQYKLSSMFAEHKDDFLLFHFEAESKKMNLIETPFAVSLQNGSSESMQYLRQLNSIPGFTAQLTLDLFSKQTIFPQLSK